MYVGYIPTQSHGAASLIYYAFFSRHYGGTTLPHSCSSEFIRKSRFFPGYTIMLGQVKYKLTILFRQLCASGK